MATRAKKASASSAKAKSPTSFKAPPPADFDKEEELHVATQLEEQLTSLRAYSASDKPEEKRKLLRLVEG